MQVLFANENVHGHVTMHLHLARAIEAHRDVDAEFFDVPPPSLPRKLFAAPVPGLGRLDLDLHPLRDQLSKSYVTRRHLRTLGGRPDALHVYTHNIALLSSKLMRDVPTVVSLDATNRQNAYRLAQRHPTSFTPLTVRITVPFERRVYRGARRVVTHSRWAADSVMTYGVPHDHIEVIPFGITVPPVDGAEVADLDEPPTIVFVASSMERKGGWKLLDMWRARFADRSRLLLVTRDRVRAESGVEVRNDVRPGDGVINTLLRGASIFALPSEIDAWGFAVLEAMSARLPVVAVRQAAMPEIVDDGRTGVLVAPGDDEGFAAAIGRLLDDRLARTAMGDAGRARLCERFDARDTTSALVELLHEVAAA